MNLIINAGLSEPPSESLYFRHFTLIVKNNLNYDVLIESQKEMIDFYFNYLKKKGMMDYVDEIIIPEDRIEGVRIDRERNYPRTIIVNRITCENILFLLGKVKLL